jgi:hypothetical protein
MPEITTRIESTSSLVGQSKPIEVKQTTVFVGGTSDPTSGMTQIEADARYVRLPVGGNDGDVPTHVGIDIVWQQPTIPLASTNW